MRAAVFLRGHRRTWDQTRDAMTQTMSAICDQTHYYICQWRTDSCRDFDAYRDMQIMHAELTGPEHWDIADNINSATAPSWQSLRCYKAMKATGIDYDMIIDTRSDIWISPTEIKISLPRQGEIYTTKLENPWYDSVMPGMEDHLFAAEPTTMGIWCQRHLRPRSDISFNHCILWQYCVDLGLEPRQIPWLLSRFVRPNVGPAPQHDSGLLSTLQHEWTGLSQQARLAHCLAMGIDPREYAAEYHIGPC